MSRPATPSFEQHTAAVRARLATARAHGLGRAGPGSLTWRVNQERVVVAGWARAILLQLAHPLVAAGVGAHSTFRGHALAPVQRLWATVGAMLSLTFGDEDEMVAAAAAINVIHDRVFGHLPGAAGSFAAGTPYSAHDAELLRWVHATLLESIPLAYERFVGPLSGAERDRYCAEAAIMEPLLGIPDGMLPRETAALDDYVRGMVEAGAIAVSPEARRLAAAVLAPPFAPLAWPALRPIRLLTIGTLPPGIREGYGFTWTPHDERALERWTRAVRGVVRATPPAVRQWRVARGALRRSGTGDQ